MSRRQLDEAIESLGDIPDVCKRQVEIQRKTYSMLIDRMEEYDWDHLFSIGVEIKEKDGDPQSFLSRLIVPVRVSVFIPGDGASITVNSCRIPSILEEKLRSIGHYMGPLGQKILSKNGEEITNPYKIHIDPKTRIARIICI